MRRWRERVDGGTVGGGNSITRSNNGGHGGGGGGGGCVGCCDRGRGEKSGLEELRMVNVRRMGRGDIDGEMMNGVMMWGAKRRGRGGGR